MGWGSAVKERPKSKPVIDQQFFLPTFETEPIDWARLVSLDFETYFDDDYTLRKLNTSEYIRDKRFKAQMVGIKIGLGKTRWYPAHKIKAALRAIPWTTHSLLCHHTQFDAFILSHHYGIQPKKLYCTLSMARGLHSQDIGAGLDEVAKFYGGRGKIEGALELTKGVLNWSPALNQTTGEYCVQDVDEMFRIFQLMLPKMPRDEIDLIDVTCRMFTDPVLLVDIPRVQKELERELAAKKELLLSVVGDKAEQARQLKAIEADAKLRMKKAFAGWLPEEILLEQARAMIGSNDKFAALLRAEGVEPPTKISPAWVKADAAKRLAMEVDNKKTVYAFSQTDLKFMELLETGTPRVRDLVETRLAVKSTTNVTRAQRFLTAGADGAFLPVYLKYAAAHTLRWGGGNKMNMQNLTRGGELRKSIKARKGEVIVVADSGQIEARMNAWLWGQEGLLQSFRVADEYEAEQALLLKEQRKVATGDNRDAYCKFADKIYGREITKHDKDERFVGKVCFAADTRVLTNHGVKTIVEVRSNDMLWDGVAWVSHDGLIHQGLKEVHRVHGLAATADHEILTEHGWQAWSEVHTSHSLFRSALSLANSPSSGGSTTSPEMASRGATDLSAVARAAPKTWSTAATYVVGVRLAVMPAPKSLQAQSGTGSIGTPWPTTSTARDYSTDCPQRSLDARIQTTLPSLTMADAASGLIRSGASIAQHSFATFKRCLVGMIHRWTWTAKTPTATTNQAISGSLVGRSTPATSGKSTIWNFGSEPSKQRTQTYDLANAGPRHCFAVVTDHGLVIAHNCVLGLGYQMGPPRLQKTLALGTMGPPVFLDIGICHRAVNVYRSDNYKIKGGWAKCQEIIEDMASGRRGAWKCISWEKGVIHLPNGMDLHYPGLRNKSIAARVAQALDPDADGERIYDEWVYIRKGQEVKIYGGLLCENLVQALARIVIGVQLLAIARKYRVVMTTHDEVVTICKAAQGQKCFDFMHKCMSTTLSWCPDLPLNAEGGFDVIYSK